MLTFEAKKGEETITVTDMIGQFLYHGEFIDRLSGSTIKTRKSHLRFFEDYCRQRGLRDVSDITIGALNRFFCEYSEARQQSTVNTARRVIKAFLTWLSLYKEFQLATSPNQIRLVRIPDEDPKALKREVIEKVIRGIPPEYEQDKLMIAVAFEAGLRISELIGITVGDIDGNKIRVVGKGRVVRLVYVTEDLGMYLYSFLSKKTNTGLQDASQPLFCNDHHNAKAIKMSIGTARIRIERWFLEIAGVKMYPHQLRHSLAVYMLECGCDIVTIQKILGHVYITTTQKYLRVTNNFLRDQHHKFFGKSVIK